MFSRKVTRDYDKMFQSEQNLKKLDQRFFFLVFRNCHRFPVGYLLQISFFSSQHFSTKTNHKSPLSIDALRACVYIYIRQLGSFRVPTLWFIDLTVATCHIHYHPLRLCQCFPRKRRKHKNTFRMIRKSITRHATH